MSTTTAGTDTGGPAGGDPASKDPYIRGTDETVLLDLRELRAQEAADRAAREAASAGGIASGAASGDGADGTADPASGPASGPETAATGTPGAELERYHGSHRRDAVLYADGGTAIPLDRVREVCHDLRQPVAAILMLASAAEMRPDVPERVRDVLQEIMSQTEEISATVRQFLDDAKQGVDGLGDPVPCNVAGLAAESVERWRATFDGDLALAAEQDPLHVTVDPVLFKRALGNVLSNGTRAAGGSGRVQVTVRRFETAQGERAVIEVDDSGPGFGNIPTGHGLGLAVVRRTIEAAGGAVEFAEGPLGGALVRLVLPVTPIRPLSADDELTKTFHGEISLTQLAAELAAGGTLPALAEFEDGFEDDFDDFDDFEDEDDFAEVREAPTPAAGGHSLTGGHAFMTRLSAWPEPMAISGAPEQLAIGGTAGPANPFAARAAEQAAIAGADNRSYFGLPPQQPSLPTVAEPTATTPTAEELPAGEPAPDDQAADGLATGDRGFFDAPATKNQSPDPGATGYFGLPLKDNTAPIEPPPAPHTRLYGPPTDIAAHPLPAGLRSAHHNTPTPLAPSEITAAAHAARPTAPVAPQPSIEPAAAAEAFATRQAASDTPAPTAAPQTLAEALAESAAAAHHFTAPALPAAPGPPEAPAEAAAQPFAASAPAASATPGPHQAPAEAAPAQAFASHATQAFTAAAEPFAGDPASPSAPAPAAAQPFAAPVPAMAAGPDSLEAPAEATPAAPPFATPATSAVAPGPFEAPAEAAPAAQPFATYLASPSVPVPAAAPQTLAEALAESAAAAQPFAGPAPAEAAADSESAPEPPEAPTFDPNDTQPLHIIPTGQDDTALASIQLPSQATLTHPPRIPASALQPVASVQLSLLPGGAF